MSEKDNDQLTKMQNQLAKLEEREEYLNAKTRRIKSRMSQQARKERTKRLIEKGAILEKFQGKESDKITPEESLEQLQQLADIQKKYALLVQITKKTKIRARNINAVSKYPQFMKDSWFNRWVKKQNRSRKTMKLKRIIKDQTHYKPT